MFFKSLVVCAALLNPAIEEDEEECVFAEQEAAFGLLDDELSEDGEIIFGDEEECSAE